MPEWRATLTIDAMDLRGGTTPVAITCTIRSTLAPSEAEAMISASLGGVMDFVASKFGLLPEEFVTRRDQLEQQASESVARAAERARTQAPSFEIVEIALPQA